MTGGSGASAQPGVLADILRKHRSSRGAFKGRITRAINALNAEKLAGTLSESLFKRQEILINRYLTKI